MNGFDPQPIELIDDDSPVSIVEVLSFAGIERALLIEFVDAGVVSPQTSLPAVQLDRWQFSRRDLRRLRTARRLVADLQLNAAGAALVLDLIDERDALRNRLRTVCGLIDDL